MNDGACYALVFGREIRHTVQVNGGATKVKPRRQAAIVVAASWLATLQLLFHVRDIPYVFKLALWIGVPLLSGIVVPRSWRRAMFLLAVPVLIAAWLSTAPWSGTSDTPPGFHWTEISFGGAAIIVGIQYLGFIVGLGLRQVVGIGRPGISRARSAALLGLQSGHDAADSVFMTYRAWRREYRRRAARSYARGYPWSMVWLGLALGLVVGLSFRNVLAGVAGAIVSTLFGLWYWKPNGRGRRVVGGD